MGKTVGMPQNGTPHSGCIVRKPFLTGLGKSSPPANNSQYGQVIFRRLAAERLKSAPKYGF